MGVIRRQINPVLIAAVHDEMLKRSVIYATVTAAQLCVVVANIFDSWHIVGDRVGGNASSSGLVEMLQDTIGGHSAEAWCMSTQQTITGVVESLLQQSSNLPASEGCLDVWRQAQARLTVLGAMSLAIQPGDVAIWRHLGADQGHTGRVVSVGLDGAFRSFEGNTSAPPGAIDRAGGGCFMKDRTRATMGTMYLLGFLREAFT